MKSCSPLSLPPDIKQSIDIYNDSAIVKGKNLYDFYHNLSSELKYAALNSFDSELVAEINIHGVYEFHKLYEDELSKEQNVFLSGLPSRIKNIFKLSDRGAEYAPNLDEIVQQIYFDTKSLFNDNQVIQILFGYKYGLSTATELNKNEKMLTDEMQAVVSDALPPCNCTTVWPDDCRACRGRTQVTCEYRSRGCSFFGWAACLKLCFSFQ